MKKQHHDHTQLSGRNILEALNNILQVLNLLLPEKEHLDPIKTPSDFDNFQKKIKMISPKTGPDSSISQQKTAINKVEPLQSSDIQALAAIATNVWRARNKMVDAESGEAKDEMKRVYRHIEAVFDALTQIGIEVRDMQGRVYDSGMLLKVVSFEPTPGLSKEEIIETIKPTIAWKGQLIQMGEVIIGTPQIK